MPPRHKGIPPKKTFLFRRNFPMLDPFLSFYGNGKPSSSPASSFHRTITNQENPKENDFKKPSCSPLMISPSISDFDEDSSDSTTAASPKERQEPCVLPLQRMYSSDSSQINGANENETENFSNCPEGSSHDRKRVSFSDICSLQVPISPESTLTSISASKDETTNTRDGVTPGERSNASQRVVDTAASVLLLMRFSVTDQALDCLTSKTKVAASTGRTEHNNSERIISIKERANFIVTKVSSRKRERPQASEFVHPITPTSSKNLLQLSKEVILPKPAEERLTQLRRISMPESSSKSHRQSQEAPPTRLSMPEDPNELNSLHCFVRAKLLEVFYLPPQKGKPNGRVGLRCLFCSHLPRKERAGTTMCTFYPKSLQDLYRSVMTWQRIHFRMCKHVPKDTQDAYWKHKESDQTRGKTEYWITSAMRLGLEDISDGRNGICYVKPATSSNASAEVGDPSHISSSC